MPLQPKLNKKIGDFIIGRVIGRGTFGKVRQGLHTLTNLKVAIKILQKSRFKTASDIISTRQQLQILKQISHPNLLKLLQVHQTSSQIFIITQLVQGQQLYNKIVKKQKLSQKQALKYFIQLYEAVKYLHDNKIVHRDIKPENIIVDGEKLKLIDFGLSKRFKQKENNQKDAQISSEYMMSTPCGSPCYAAPEMVREKIYDSRKVDVWAMGVTLFAMLKGRLPFQHQNTQKLYKMIEKAQVEDIQNISSCVNLLIKAMIEKDTKKRINIDEIGQNIWLRNYTTNTNNNKTSRSMKSTITTNKQSQLNLQILNKMQKTFKKSSSFLIKQMKKHPLSDYCTYYYLSNQQFQKRFEQNKKIPQHQLHQGPFHIQFVFKNIQLIEKYLNKLNIKYEWLIQVNLNEECTYRTIKIDEQVYSIKRLKNLSTFYYLPLNKEIILDSKNKSASLRQRNNQCQRQKNNKSCFNQQTSGSSFYSPNSDRKNVCMETF